MASCSATYCLVSPYASLILMWLYPGTPVKGTQSSRGIEKATTLPSAPTCTSISVFVL
ncbi:Uncharacterised protein [Mycobacterium tuberculosis]|uniref:Uncharacterized protein n=1 Tax=Mycobacterium tuberculosis TaxID=1773 RepID=A0A916PBH3_MYCTX|nr:Uncharacterised protein [Mycobacterium tuberculosis]